MFFESHKNFIHDIMTKHRQGEEETLHEEEFAHKNKNGLKWFVTVVSSSLLVISTIYRLRQNLEADRTLSAIFAFIAGLPWGANIIDYLKKK